MVPRDWTQPSSDTLVEYQSEGGIATLTLNDPPANTYSYAMMRQLDEAILRARFDAAVHVLVLTGRGDKFFCAGANIQMLQEVTPQFKYSFCLHANETLLRLEQTPKLVVCAINGHCVGGGLEVALAADIRLMVDKPDVKIGLPEVNLGVLPGTGGTQRLARLLGKSKTIEMLATGENVSPQDALTLGLVNRLLPAGEFRDRVSAYAKTFLPPHRASLAVGLMKRAVSSGLESGLSEGLALERELQQRLFESEDSQEGLRAFTEKRAAQFQGK